VRCRAPARSRCMRRMRRRPCRAAAVAAGDARPTRAQCQLRPVQRAVCAMFVAESQRVQCPDGRAKQAGSDIPGVGRTGLHARRSLVAAGLGRRECGSLRPPLEVHRLREQGSRVCCWPAHQAPPVLGVGWRHHVCGAAAVGSQQRRAPGDTAGRPVWPGLRAYMCMKRVRCRRARAPAPARARGSVAGCGRAGCSPRPAWPCRRRSPTGARWPTALLAGVGYGVAR